MAVSADHSVGIGHSRAFIVIGPNCLGQIFQVHLVTDAGAGWHHAEVVEGRGSPAQEPVTLDVALILPFDIVTERLGGTEIVHHHRVVDHQIDRHQRIDFFRVGAQLGHGVTHGGQIDHGGHASKVLHQYASRAEANFVFDRTLVVDPGGQRLEVIRTHGLRIFVAQQVLQQHLH